jgi:hypothetical protein
MLQLMGEGEVPRRIIGVAGNVRHFSPEDIPKPEVYLLYGQTASPAAQPMRIVLRPRVRAALGRTPPRGGTGARTTGTRWTYPSGL